MAVPTFPPNKDNELVSWSTNWDQRITSSAVSFGLTAAQATAYTPLHNAFVSTYAAAVNPNTNSKATIAAKNDAKEQLLYGPGGAWQLVNIVQAFPGTTDTMRAELGLRIPDRERTPVAAPRFAPVLDIEFTKNRTVKIRLRDQENPDRRGKPDGVDGATLLYCVSDTEPDENSQWLFLANTSKTLVVEDIPLSVPAGSKVWLTAFWFNARKETSPAATAQSTRIAHSLPQAA